MSMNLDHFLYIPKKQRSVPQLPPSCANHRTPHNSPSPARQANELNSLLDQQEQAMWGDQRGQPPPQVPQDQAAGGYGQAPPGWGAPQQPQAGEYDALGK